MENMTKTQTEQMMLFTQSHSKELERATGPSSDAGLINFAVIGFAAATRWKPEGIRVAQRDPRNKRRTDQKKALGINDKIQMFVCLQVSLELNRSLATKSYKSVEHALTHTLNQALTHTLNQTLTHTLNQALTHTLNQALTHTLNQALTHTLNQAVTHTLNQALTLTLNQALTYALIYSL